MKPHSFATPENVERGRQALEADGFLLLEDRYAESTCGELIRVMDSQQSDDRAESNYAGSEIRIWDAQRRHELFLRFFDEANQFVTALEHRRMDAYTLLAIRNRALNPDDVTSARGRWHIDSFRRQLKVFLFLTNTTESSGPFEFLPGTHRAGFKARMLIRGVYLRPLDLVRRTRAYSSLDDEWVEALVKQGYSRKPVLCTAGTVMVIDTSAIHRARPCIKGTRYALTAYYR